LPKLAWLQQTAVLFASPKWQDFGGTPLLIQGLQLRLHIAHLCQSTMLFEKITPFSI